MVARCEEISSVHGSGETVETKLYRIAEKARREPGFKFTSLYYLMNVELLRGCFRRLRMDAAAGIDKMNFKVGGTGYFFEIKSGGRKTSECVKSAALQQLG